MACLLCEGNTVLPRRQGLMISTEPIDEQLHFYFFRKAQRLLIRVVFLPDALLKTIKRDTQHGYTPAAVMHIFIL